MLSLSFRRVLPLAATALLLPAPSVRAAAEPDRAAFGNPSALVAQPEAVTLAGPRARQQLVVTARYGDNAVRDATPFAEYACEPADQAAVKASGFVTPKKNGTGVI